MNPSKNVFSQSELRIPWKLNNYRQYDRDDLADEEAAASAALTKLSPRRRINNCIYTHADKRISLILVDSLSLNPVQLLSNDIFAVVVVNARHYFTPHPPPSLLPLLA